MFVREHFPAVRVHREDRHCCSMQMAHAGSHTVLPAANTNRHGRPLFIRRSQGEILCYRYTNSATCPNRGGSHKGRYKLIRQKGLNIIPGAHALQASPPRLDAFSVNVMQTGQKVVGLSPGRRAAALLQRAAQHVRECSDDEPPSKP